MKKVRAVGLLVLFGVVALALSFASIFPVSHSSSDFTGTVSANASLPPAVSDRFTYLEPQWESDAWYAAQGVGEKGSYKIVRNSEAGNDKRFILQTKTFYNTGAAAENIGKDVPCSCAATNQCTCGKRPLPVFSSRDMHDIARDLTKVYVSENRDDAAFVMLDNTLAEREPGQTHAVVFELRDLDALFTDQMYALHNGVNILQAQPNPLKPRNDTEVGFLQGWQTTAEQGSRQQVRGRFVAEGYYEFGFRFMVRDPGGSGSASTTHSLVFGFYIGHSSNYINPTKPTDAAPSGLPRKMPVFDLRITGQPFDTSITRSERDEHRYFYNFQGSSPTVEFDTNRYDVSIHRTDPSNIREMIDPDSSGGFSPPTQRYTLEMLGRYDVMSHMYLPILNIRSNPFGEEPPIFVNRRIDVSKFYAPHRYFLDIFGFQANYWDFENDSYKLLAGDDERLPPGHPERHVDSDVSKVAGVQALNVQINSTLDPTDRVNAANTAIRNLTNPTTGPLRDINPAVTNQPPIALRYNVSHAFDSKLCFTVDGKTECNINHEHTCYQDCAISHVHKTRQILTRIAYRKDKLYAWQYDNPYGTKQYADYVIGRPFQEAGEYAVIVYYSYDIAGDATKIFHQVFYFKINNFAADVLLKIGAGTANEVTTPFNELTGEILNTSGGIEVLFASPPPTGNSNLVGPFDAVPRIEVVFRDYNHNWIGTILDFNSLHGKTTDEIRAIPGYAWYGSDGIYSFNIYFGNNPPTSNLRPYIQFNVVIDTTPIDTFNSYVVGDAGNTGVKVNHSQILCGGIDCDEDDCQGVCIVQVGGNQSKNIAMFGDVGNITLEWGKKPSGVAMVAAWLDFYEFEVIQSCRDAECNRATCPDFHHSTQTAAPVLESQFRILPAPIDPKRLHFDRNVTLRDNSLGYRLATPVASSGLYVITVLDAAEIESRYIILIDGTRAAFAQNPEVVRDDINIIHQNAAIGFGKEKLIANSTIAGAGQKLANLDDYLGNLHFGIAESPSVLGSVGTVNGIKIPIMRVEMRKQAVETTYHRVFTWGSSTSLINLSDEALYSFHAFDIFSGQNDGLDESRGEHHLEINYDVTRSVILEDDARSSLTESGKFIGNPTRIFNDQISNRGFLTFSFLQVPRVNTAEGDWRVDEVNFAFYPFTYQEASINNEGEYVIGRNSNYPFSDEPVRVAGALYDDNDFTVYVETDDTREQRVGVDINRFPQTTRQGLYVISRICRNVPLNGSMNYVNCGGSCGPECNGRCNIRNFYFIVDSNPIIANHQNFQSGITIEFTTAARTKFARHNDFQRINNAHLDPGRDRVLRANTTNTRVRLPGSTDGLAGTKYGVSDSNIKHDTFGVRPKHHKECIEGVSCHPSCYVNIFPTLFGDVGLGLLASSITFKSLSLNVDVERRAPCPGTGTSCDCGCPSCPPASGICTRMCQCPFEDFFAGMSSRLNLNIEGMYRVAFTDSSGLGIPVMPGVEMSEGIEGNRSEILVDILTEGPQGNFSMNGRRVSPSSYFTTRNNRGTFNSARVANFETDTLTFRYTVEDTSNFLEPVKQLHQQYAARELAVQLHRPNFHTWEIHLEPRSADDSVNKANLRRGWAIWTMYTVGSSTFYEVALPMSATTTLVPPFVYAAPFTIQNQDVFIITLKNGIDNQTRTFQMLLDNTPPGHNLNALANADAWFSGASGNRDAVLAAEGYKTSEERAKVLKANNRLELNGENRLRYPFTITKEQSFSFQRPTPVNTSAENVPLFDSATVSYTEVDAQLSFIPNVSVERTVQYGVPFWNQIWNENGSLGMRDNESRFFRIIEHDEAGNRAEYFVQLRGNNYVDQIRVANTIQQETVGEVLRPKRQNDYQAQGNLVEGNIISRSLPVRGYELSVSVSEAREFFRNNLFFDFNAGGVTVKRLGFNVMMVDMGLGAGVQQRQATPEIFTEALQRMIEVGRRGNSAGAETGGSVDFTYNSRFWTNQWALRQITRNTPLFAVNKSVESWGVEFSIDDSELADYGFDSEGYMFEVYSESASGLLTPIASGQGIMRNFIGDSDVTMRVFVTDEFGRLVRGVHYSDVRERRELLYNEIPIDELASNAFMVTRVGDELYLGEGVRFVYSPSAFNLEIWKDGAAVFNNSMLTTYLNDYNSGALTRRNSIAIIDVKVDGMEELYTLAFYPETDKVTHWRIVSYRLCARSNGWNEDIRWDEQREQEFFLYGELPKMQFSRQSGEDLTEALANNELITGNVMVAVSFNHMKFRGGNLDYVRHISTCSRSAAAINCYCPVIPVYDYMTLFSLVHEGRYEFIARNALGYSSIIESFEIIDVSNRHYKVFFDDYDGGEPKELKESPVLFPYLVGNVTTYIPNYFVSADVIAGNNLDLRVLSLRGNEGGRIQIVPTTNSSWKAPVPVGIATNANNTQVYRIDPGLIGNSIYLAITAVSKNDPTLGGVNLFPRGPNDPVTDEDSDAIRFFQDDKYDNVSRVLVKSGNNHYRPSEVITVGLTRGYFNTAGNVLEVEYSRILGDDSEEYLGTLYGTQKLKIPAKDYGVYRFRVKDLAGNVRVFDGGMDIDYFTVINLARAPLYIRAGAEGMPAPLVDGMVYEGPVSIGVQSLPFGIYSHFGELVPENTTVYHDNIRLTNYSLNNLREPGMYRIEARYRFGGTQFEYVNSVFTFVIAPTDRANPAQNFSFVAPDNTEIMSIKLNDREIRGRFDGTVLRQVAFNAATGNGRYVVTLRMREDSLYQYERTHEFQVMIGARAGAAGTTFEILGKEDGGFGKKHTPGEGLIILANTASISDLHFGTRDTPFRVIVFRNDTVVSDLHFGGSNEDDPEIEDKWVEIIQGLKAVGKYRIYIASEDARIAYGSIVSGRVYEGQGFEIIAQGANVIGTIIVVVLVILAVAVVLIFIKFRKGMRVR